tara:strand:+ start:870 stop:1097 length:228 start_codon:yes stop_codon:yes gene_type:complete
MISDKQLNKFIDKLLAYPKQDRKESQGEWANMMDEAMALWESRHPGTRPPAYTKIPKPPKCFTGKLPPIYSKELK